MDTCATEAWGDARGDDPRCLSGVIDAERVHLHVVSGLREPREAPRFAWVDAILDALTKLHPFLEEFQRLRLDSSPTSARDGRLSAPIYREAVG